MSEFLYEAWPVEAKGNAKKPEFPGAQWEAWISAGGQHDAVVCNAPSKDAVLALRRHVLTYTRPNEAPISRTAGLLLERIGIAMRLARHDNDEALFKSIDKLLTRDIQTMDEVEMGKAIYSLGLLIQNEVSRERGAGRTEVQRQRG